MLIGLTYLINIPRKKKKNYEVEYDYIEEKSAISGKDWDKSNCSAIKTENDLKNRYPDVLALEESRVKLITDDEDKQDYINANFIRNYLGDKIGYISTQGPLNSTIQDFWRMIWQEKVTVLVMLTKEFENGVNKSARYWPSNRSIMFGNFQITVLSTEKDPITGDDLLIRKLIVKNSKELDEPEREVIHFQYTGWPDHGLPPQSRSHHFLHLLSLVDNAIAEKGGLICIHCSAGIGRSGTFCTIHMNVHILRDYLEKYKILPPISVVNTVLDLRKQRHGMVQTKEQFLFCYQIIVEEYNRLKEIEKKLRNSNEDSHSHSNSQQPPVQNNNEIKHVTND
jgi:protein tyrosine phosphatase